MGVMMLCKTHCSNWYFASENWRLDLSRENHLLTENHHQVLGDSKKVTTHPWSTPVRQSPFSTMKGFPAYSLLVKVFFGVCSSSVCWNNLRGIRFCQATIQILLSLLMSFRNIAPISSKSFRGGRKQRQSNGVRKGKNMCSVKKACTRWN